MGSGSIPPPFSGRSLEVATPSPRPKPFQKTRPSRNSTVSVDLVPTAAERVEGFVGNSVAGLGQPGVVSVRALPSPWACEGFVGPARSWSHPSPLGSPRGALVPPRGGLSQGRIRVDRVVGRGPRSGCAPTFEPTAVPVDPPCSNARDRIRNPRPDGVAPRLGAYLQDAGCWACRAGLVGSRSSHVRGRQRWLSKSRSDPVRLHFRVQCVRSRIRRPYGFVPIWCGPGRSVAVRSIGGCGSLRMRETVRVHEAPGCPPKIGVRADEAPHSIAVARFACSERGLSPADFLSLPGVVQESFPSLGYICSRRSFSSTSASRPRRKMSRRTNASCTTASANGRGCCAML